MKFLGLIFFLFPLISFSAKNSVILTYQYKKSSSSSIKAITLEELKWVYTLTKQQAPYYPPSPSQFFTDYLRFKLGVEAALHNKKLVANSKIDKFIASRFLKASFHQELYKAFAELSLQTRIKKLQKTTMALSNKQLQNLYKKDSQYNFFYISIYHPVNPSPVQKKEATTRSRKVHAQIRSSKKPFTELVALTSDDKYGGLLNWNRTRASIDPKIYAVIKNMKDGTISRPIKVANGYVIVKLNQKVPYNKSIHEKPLKDNFFAERKTKLFNRYMDGLKKDFKITYVNKNLVKSLR